MLSCFNWFVKLKAEDISKSQCVARNKHKNMMLTMLAEWTMTWSSSKVSKYLCSGTSQDYFHYNICQI